MTPDKPVSKRTNLTTDDLVGHLFATMDCGRYPCPICAAIRDGLKERDAALSDLAAIKAENAKLKQHNELLWTMENEVAEKVKAENADLRAEVDELNEALWYWYEVALEYSDMPADRGLIEKELADLRAFKERVKPLLKAADRLEVVCGNYNTMTLLDLGYAAVKYRDAALAARTK